MKLGKIITALAFSAVTSGYSQVTNGSFENPDLSAVGLTNTTYTALSSALNGWTVINGTAQLIDKTYTSGGVTYLPNSGDQSVSLSAPLGSSAVIQQFIPTTAGETYTLSFALGSIGSPATAALLVNGVANTFSASSATANTLTWQTQLITFTASSSSTLLQFSNLGSNYVGLDSISVTVPVPEPGSFLLGASGLLLLAGRRRRA